MNWSQRHLGELVSVRQQTVANYETARLRVAASLLPKLAHIFGVSADDLLSVPKLVQHMERISQLSKQKQRFVIQVLESALAQQA